MKRRLLFLTVAVSLMAPLTQARADDARLKETLRTLTLRLGSAETERNNLLSEKAQFDQEKKTLTDKANALTKQAADQKTQLDTCTTKAMDQEKELTEAKDSLTKW